MKKLSIAAFAIVTIIILIFSIVSYITLPKTFPPNDKIELTNFVSNSSLPQGNFTFSAFGQSATYWIEPELPTVNWTASTTQLMPLYILKTSQNISFPITNVTISISQLSLLVNGQNQAPTPRGTLLKPDGVVFTYMYWLNPLQNYNGTISVTVSFHIELYLVSGPYWFSVSEGIQSFSKNLTLS